VRLERQSHRRLDKSNTYFVVSYFNKRYLYIFFIWVPTPSAYSQLDYCRPYSSQLTLFLAFLQGCLVSLVGIQLHTQTQIYASKSIYIYTTTWFLTRDDNEVHTLNNHGLLVLYKASVHSLRHQCDVPKFTTFTSDVKITIKHNYLVHSLLYLLPNFHRFI